MPFFVHLGSFSRSQYLPFCYDFFSCRMLVNFIEENPLVSTSFVACSCSLISFDDVPDSLMPTSIFLVDVLYTFHD